MPEQEQPEITAALEALRRGAPAAMEQLVPLVYGELRRIAHRQLGAERTGHTLSTTALVHEAYLRLAEQRQAPIDHAHFFAIASRIMRRILVDYARRHGAIRRGGSELQVVSLDDVEDAGALTAADRADELLALDEALEQLAVMDERLARVVECRFFGGLTEQETAEALGISQRTVARERMLARGWLFERLRRDVA